jgi:hypothetical protein
MGKYIQGHDLNSAHSSPSACAQKSVAMNKHLSTPSPDGRPSLLDNISDSLVNAFTKVRKPDERFLEMREAIDKYEEAMNSIDRLVSKERSRTEGSSRGTFASSPAI